MLLKKTYSLIILLLIILFLAILFSLKIGSVEISINNMYRLLTLKEVDVSIRRIVLDLRLPRILMAIICGAALALAGTVLQSILKNPLADPYLLGISAGAGIGATVYILLLASYSLPYLLPAFAFVGSLLSISIILTIAGIKKSLSSSTLILSGVMLNAFFTSIIMVLMTFKHQEFMKIFFWLLGYLGGVDLNDVLIAGIFIVIGVILIFFQLRNLNALACGDEVATYLGINVKKAKLTLIIIISFITGICVSYSGLIGFVGLVVPHLMRLLIGSDHRRLIPVSLLTGSILLVLADTISRTIISPLEFPVGVITAIAGVPFFLYLFLVIGKVRA